MTEKLLFTGKTHNTGGRNGGTRSDDGMLDLKLAQPHPAAENLFGCLVRARHRCDRGRRLPEKDQAYGRTRGQHRDRSER